MNYYTELKYPIDKEQELLDSIRTGDFGTGKELLNEILLTLFHEDLQHFQHIQYRAIELSILMSRVGISLGFTVKSIFDNNSRYIKLIQKTNNKGELITALHKVMGDLAEQIHRFRGTTHASALKRAEDFIYENLSRKISLEEIAKASGFSAPYFSTMFKDEMGENLSNYLNRLRVERAAALLEETDYSLSYIAGFCGFEDQSWFSKIFKAYAGTSPGKYRSQGGKMPHEIPENSFPDDFLKPGRARAVCR